jgi:Fe2+ transport system protein FeoA
MFLQTASDRRTDSLDRLSPGTEGIVLSLGGGAGFRSKMYQLGIHESSRLKVVKNTGFGPLVVESGGTRLIMGRAMAGRIRIVKRAETN